MPRQPSSEPQPELKRTRFANFVAADIPRDQIKNAPYNPRRITEDARRKLRKNIEKVGLLEPIIWNKRTGNVVGGHQRLKCLDLLEQRSDFLVPVAVVHLDEATEKQQNVFLNNGEAQGEWDLLQLGDLFKGMAEPELTGFDRGDLFNLFGCDPTQTTILAPEVPQEPTPSTDLARAGENPDQDWERRKDEGKEREQGDFYRVIVFGSDEEAKAFDEEYGFKPGRYIDPKTLVRKIKGE